MTRKVIDVDDVLANFYLAMCRKFNKPYISTDIWEVKWIGEVFDQVMNDEEFWENLPVLSPPESITFDFDFYLTAMPPQMQKARARWLQKNGYPDKPLIVSNEKTKFCLKNDIQVIIDDKPTTVKEAAQEGIIAFQFVPYYYPENRMYQGVKIIRHLDEVTQILKENEK
jgi:hypothetical protein